MTGNVPKNFDPRPPKDRRVTGDDSENTTASGRKRRRSRSSGVGGDGTPSGKGSFVGKLTGRAELDRAKTKRYDPYKFHSNNTQLKWTVISLMAFAAIAVMLAWGDRATSVALNDLSDQGFASVPPASRTPATIIDFAAREGIPCDDENAILTGAPECDPLFVAQKLYGDAKDLSSTLFVFLMLALLATIFSFGSFTHRANRNLLTLKSKGQGYSPEKTVFWFFIPVLNLVKPWAVYRELFKASDPAVSTLDELEWKKKGSVPAKVNIWAGIFIVIFFFNPMTIGRLWNPVRETYEDVISAHQQLIVADLLLAMLAIAAIFMVVDLNRRQEQRHKKVGDITVTPPRPRDPLEEALKDGIRRKELENRRARSSKDRDER